jgi:hypothetical protein
MDIVIGIAAVSDRRRGSGLATLYGPGLRGKRVVVVNQSGGASAVPDVRTLKKPGEDYKFISNVIAFVRPWGVAGFQPLEALMSTRLVRSNRGMSNRSVFWLARPSM